RAPSLWRPNSSEVKSLVLANCGRGTISKPVRNVAVLGYSIGIVLRRRSEIRRGWPQYMLSGRNGTKATSLLFLSRERSQPLPNGRPNIHHAAMITKKSVHLE